MKIAYHFTIPQPPKPELDAVIQDALTLQQTFPGHLNYLYPSKKASRLIPRFLCGLHQLPYLNQLDNRVDIHQIYSNEFYYFPILHRFQKPIIYTIVTSLPQHKPWYTRLLNQVSHYVLSNPTDKAIMQAWGINNVSVVRPGINIASFSHTPSPPLDNFTIMVGSAPWNLAQFHSKGIDLLLEVLTHLPTIRLVLLWRGVHFYEIQHRVAEANLSHRVEIINRRVKVHEVLKRVHAAIVLAKNPTLIKAYPHSLLEALAAGRPIIVSDGLAMADYVRKTNCGLTLPDFSLTALIQTILQLKQQYQAYQKQVERLDLQPFSIHNLVEAYQKIYHQFV